MHSSVLLAQRLGPNFTFADVTAACIIDDFKTASLVERVETILRTLSTENAQRDFELKELRLPADSLIDEFFSTFPNGKPSRPSPDAFSCPQNN